MLDTVFLTGVSPVRSMRSGAPNSTDGEKGVMLASSLDGDSSRSDVSDSGDRPRRSRIGLVRLVGVDMTSVAPSCMLDADAAAAVAPASAVAGSAVAAADDDEGMV